MSIFLLSTGYLGALGKAYAKGTSDASITSTRVLSLPDLFLTLKVQEAFSAEPALQNAPIAIDTFAGIVHLSGVVKARYQQVIAVHVASCVSGVRAINNRIQLGSPSGEKPVGQGSRYGATFAEVGPVQGR